MASYDEQLIIAELADPKKRSKAFEKVVRQYSRKLYWQIRHIVVNHDDTDDVLQNTFVKAWKNLDSFKGESKLSTWLYRIAYNESLNFIKQNREFNPLENFTEEDEQKQTLHIESDEYLDGDRTQRLLLEAINLLPTKQKAVFTMKYFDERKYEEIAEITGTSIGALKASYHFAVEKITKFIKAHDN